MKSILSHTDHWKFFKIALCIFTTSLMATFNKASADQACPAERTFNWDNRGDQLVKFDFNGTERSYILHVDSNYNPSRATDVIFAFHGGYGDACKMRSISKYNNKMLKMGYSNRPMIVVYPNGVQNYQAYKEFGQRWNDGRVDLGANAIDDIGFVHRILFRLKFTHGLNINDKRVFASGVSNGGMFALRLSRQSMKFTAVAAISATIPKNLLYRRPYKVTPTLIVHGTLDDRIPYNGGVVNSPLGGEVLSAKGSFLENIFLINDNSVVIENLPSSYLSSGITRLQLFKQIENRVSYRDKKRMELITVHGGGHCWHGLQASQPPAGSTGACGTRFDVTAESLLFFDNQPSL